MQFWGYFNRNSSGMHPYDYRQGSYRDGSGGERIRNQEGRQSSNPNMMSDKKKSEDFVVLSLEEIKRRKSENFQAAAETKDHSLASKEGQDEDTPLNTDDHNQNNGAGFGKRGSQSLETERVDPPAKAEKVGDFVPTKYLQAASETVDAPDYEMSDEEVGAVGELAPQDDLSFRGNVGGNNDTRRWHDSGSRNEGERCGPYKRFKRSNEGYKDPARRRDGEDDDRANNHEGRNRNDATGDNCWGSRQSPHQIAPDGSREATSNHHTQTSGSQGIRDPWRYQDQPVTWCDNAAVRGGDLGAEDEQSGQQHHASHTGEDNNSMDVGDQRVDKYGHRDARRIYDDGEYYENPNRTGVRDDDNKKRESHQASNNYRGGTGDRQNFYHTHGSAHRYNQYDRRMNNSGYADRDQERHQHGGTWDGWQYGGNKSDASRQSFGPSDSYRDPVKSSSIPHQHDTHDAGFHKSDYDDGNRAKVAPKMGYGRKDARFTHQGVSSNRFPQRGLSQGVSIPSDEPTQRGVANARYGYKGYDSSFQRPPHRRSDHSGSAKDDYPHYPHQDVRDEPRHDPRRPHRPAHPMDHQDDNDNEQGMKRGKQPDIPGFLPRGRLPKRPRSHGSPQSPSRSSDARQEIMIRGRIPGADADLTEPKTQGDVFHQGASDYTDFYSLERAIMLEPLASVCSSFFEAIDRGVEPSLECCRKLLMASSSRGEVVIMRKVLSYMQYAFRDLMRSDDYIIATQGYALLGDSQNIKNVRDYAAKQGIILSPASWVQLLRYVCSVDKNTPDITRIVVEETLKGSATSALSSALDFLLHQCLENSLTEECMQIIHKFRKISTDGEYVFDSRTLTDLVEHLMSLSDFRSACQIIQLSYSLKQNVSIKTVLSFVSECASRQRYSNLAKQAYLLLRRYDRFSYRDAEQLQNVIEGLAKARLIPESIVVLQDVVSSMFPINSPHALIALLTSITDEADCKEAISTFKQLLSQRSLVPRQNSKLYEELTRFFFENGTPENIMWLRDYSRDLCIAMTSAMRRFLLNSEGAFITNSDIVGVKSPNHGPQDTYQNMPFNTARSSE